jgi:hypothetical protein
MHGFGHNQGVKTWQIATKLLFLGFLQEPQTRIATQTHYYKSSLD